MKDVFQFRDNVINNYQLFSRSFTNIAAPDIKKVVDAEYEAGRYWPDPLIQINPNYKKAKTVAELCKDGSLNPECEYIFRADKNENDKTSGNTLTLYTHQQQSLAFAQNKESYVVTTGTGSGKSLSFFIPIVNEILNNRASQTKQKTSAIIIYPMNALANSQLQELKRYLAGYPENAKPFNVGRFTGQEKQAEREEIANNPPDILLTNFMMMELLLTRGEEIDRKVIEHCEGLKFIVLDELHTYRGRQGADVALLVRRLRQETKSPNLICVGTSATMSNKGSEAEQRKTVSDVASLLFGTEIKSDNVIGETLTQSTDETKNLENIKPFLKERILNSKEISTVEEFKEDILSIWIELTLGIDKKYGDITKRAKPLTLSEAAKKLSEDSGVKEKQAEFALKDFLNKAKDLPQENGRQLLAFKLHQFISGPGQVLCTLEKENERLITLDAQVFAPGREKEGVYLYPTYFCRDCGIEYFPVKLEKEKWLPRDINETIPKAMLSYMGFLVPKKCEGEFKYQIEEDDCPEDWFDYSKDPMNPKIKKDKVDSVPHFMYIDETGNRCVKDKGNEFVYIPGHIRFCPCCGNEYNAHASDRNTLAGLNGEGRSSATTMISLAVLNELFYKGSSDNDARKMLGFTDNRQDAALQAGHFNDFISLITLRSALLKALDQNNGRIRYKDLTEKVFAALGFDTWNKEILSEYIVDPDKAPHIINDIKNAEKFVLGYRLIRDLRKGWRNNNPSLENLGLLHIEYEGLDELCKNDSKFDDIELVNQLSPKQRELFYKYVFTQFKKFRCINSVYFSKDNQERVRNSNYNSLTEAWGFDEEKLDFHNYVIFEVAKRIGKTKNFDTISATKQSQLIKNLRRENFWKETPFATEIFAYDGDKLSEVVYQALVQASFVGLVDKFEPVHGWYLNPNAMVWCSGEDEILKIKENKFFISLYETLKEKFSDVENYIFDYTSHEHTAQVASEDRVILEQRFRYTESDQSKWFKEHNGQKLPRLPILYCSPTMELGVDISSLNTVYMRNVPPTASNYAQRSGRAGRSGQPAFVTTYCSSLSPHDQWYFNKREDMVNGIVKAPTLDITNRELVKSHIHSVWLQVMGFPFGSNIAYNPSTENPNGIIDVSDEENLPIRTDLIEKIKDAIIIEETKREAKAVLQNIRNTVSDKERNFEWLQDAFVDECIDSIYNDFNKSFDSWRTLYKSIQEQMNQANRIAMSPASSPKDRESAKKRFLDASNQFNVLLGSQSATMSEFYPYRYLAGQGFLPGYDFPRLPLMAWIPSTRAKGMDIENTGTMVSRPRFLGISEFGPQSVIYHDGRQYRVYKAKLSTAGGQVAVGGNLPTRTILVCKNCGYGHINTKNGTDILDVKCRHCGADLESKNRIDNLYRIETVETKVAQKISANEEERLRKGYELQTIYQFDISNGKPVVDKATMKDAGNEEICTLEYGQNATIWRVNKGWRKRKNPAVLGFNINPMTGVWEKEPDVEDDEDTSVDDTKIQPQRIVPFVEDYKNVLILSLKKKYSVEVMATLESALQRAIEEEYQIEQSELSVEPLPSFEDCNGLLFYEASEGGAGVLTNLVKDEKALSNIAKTALKIMHYKWNGEKPISINDLIDEESEKPADKRCVAGCYKCLLSYYNQPLHNKIDRRLDEVKEILITLISNDVVLENTNAASEQTFSDENTFESFVKSNGIALPDSFGKMTSGVKTLAIWKSSLLVAVDEQNADFKESMEDLGYTVLVFGKTPNEWKKCFEENKNNIPMI